MEHGSPLPAQDWPLPSLSAYAQLTWPVNAFLYPETRAILAQHNYAHQIMHPPSTGEHRNYLQAAPGLESRTNAPLQGNKMRPRVIHYVNETVLLFSQLPSLLCLLFYDALSHHVHAFLFMSVIPEAEMASQDEMATQEQHAE